MDKRELSIALSKLKVLENRDIFLEQYQTDIKTAVSFLYFVYENNGILGKTIADFGCGNGILGIGAALLGAQKVDFYDISENAVEVCKENVKSFGFNFDVFKMDFFDVNKNYDTVISNPPFGIKNRFDIEIFIRKLKSVSKEFFIILPDNGKTYDIAKRNYLILKRLGDLAIPAFSIHHKREIFKVPVVILYNV